MKKTLLLLTLICSGIAEAQLLFQDDFSSYTSGLELSGQGLWSNSPTSPNVGIGACLPQTAGSPCSGTKVIDQPLEYLNYGASTKSIEIGPLKDGVARAINPVITDGNLYLGLVLNISSAPEETGPPVDFLRVINSDQTMVTFRMVIKNAGFGYYVGIRKGGSGNATVYTTDLYNYGENVLVILKYSHLSGPDDDIVNAYVNPDYIAGEPLIAAATTTSGFDQSGAIDRIAFRLNYNVIASMPTGFAGLVSTATTWEGLTFQPLAVTAFEINQLTIATSLENNTLHLTAANDINNVDLNIYSVTGSLIESKSVNIMAGNSEISLKTKLHSGMYIAQFADRHGMKHSYKFISK